MIYFSADDYGLSNTASMHIQSLIDEGKINKVSVFPNFDKVDLGKIKEKKDVLISLHLNLVEGRCMADADEIDLIADKDGNFRHTFGGLLKSSLLHRKKFKEQVYKEIKEQITYWRDMTDGEPFCIDSHQHTHMIPAVFDAIVKILDEEKINLKYIRIPAEPLLPYIKTPSLYLT